MPQAVSADTAPRDAPRGRGLRARSAVTVALALAPALLLSIYFAQGAWRAARLDASRELTRDLRAAATDALTTTARLRGLIDLTARLAAAELAREGDCLKAIDAFQTLAPGATRAGLFNAEGRSICGATRGLSMSGQPVWNEYLRSGALTLGPPRTGRLTGKTVMVAVLPYHDAKSGAAAFITGLEFDMFRALADTEVNSFALFDAMGTLVAQNSAAPEGWIAANRAELLSAPGAVRSLRSEAGDSRLYVARPLLGGELWAVSSAAQSKLFSEFGLRDWLQILAPVLVWLGAVLAVAVAVDRLALRHILKLRRIIGSARSWRADAAPTLAHDAPAELVDLRDRFVATWSQLAETVEARDALIAAQHGLLLEVHHRVKNNLQLISSLLNMELRDASEPSGLRRVQDRVHAIALVHQQLYESERLDRVHLSSLCATLADSLARSLGAVDRLHFLTMDEGVVVDSGVATPTALFLAEALENALKHGAQADDAAGVEITLLDLDDAFELRVENPAGPDGGEVLGMGRRLMRSLARQLDAQLRTQTRHQRHSVRLRASKLTRAGEFQLRQSASAGSAAT